MGYFTVCAVRESGGTAFSVSNDAMVRIIYYAAQRAGMLIVIEAVATLAAYTELPATLFLAHDDETVLFFYRQ